MSENLTHEEINQMMEALDAMEAIAQLRPMLSMIAMLPMLKGAANEQTIQGMFEKLQDGNRDKAQNTKERVILLKAKLLKLRDQAEAQAAAEAMRTGKVDP